MKTIEISFLVGIAILAVGLWMLAPWLAVTVVGLLVAASAALAHLNEPADTKK